VSEGRRPPEQGRKVIDLAQQRHKRLVLAEFDRQQHQADREAREKRAEVERLARHRV
jgi:hypothetical protein